MGARASVRPSQCSRSRPAGRWRSRSRKTSAPDWPVPISGDVPGGQQRVAVAEVVGGVHDGDGGVLDEGPERVGDVRFGADAEDDVPGVGAAEGLGLPVGVELGVVDLEEIAVRVPADGVDLVVEAERGRFSATQRQ
ncbi:hypothetical protein STENM36S_09340 [Streptomyces tendae]